MHARGSVELRSPETRETRAQSRAFSHARGHLRVSGSFAPPTKKKDRLLVVYRKSNGNEVAPERYLSTQIYGGPLVSLKSRHMKVIWTQTTRHARYTRVSSSRAPFFLVPRYYLHVPATQAIPLPSVRQRSHDPCGDEIGTLRTNALTDPHNH